MDSSKQYEICKECGAYCCSFGGTVATKEEVEELITNWKTGNLKGIENMIFADEYMSLPHVDALFNKLYFKRNNKMAKKIMEYLNDTEDYFIVIGVDS